MDIRENAVTLSDEKRDKFLEAIIGLKHRPAPNLPDGDSVYDQFVALHGAVVAVIVPQAPVGETVNFAHWNIGFCPWHRQYLREFEKALQAEVPGVTIPYWDWPDHVGALGRLFVPEFLGSLREGLSGPVPDGVLRNPVPLQDRPAWWPEGAKGFPIHPLLREQMLQGSVLFRGSAGISWPPTASAIMQLEQMVIQQPGFHPLWYFWVALEKGYLNPHVTTPTHNAGHLFIGGHMLGAFSPNDPVFWLHHANVDRLWANWQARRLATVAGSAHADHWPPPGELSPFDGKAAPPGHRLNDEMWPWIGEAQGYNVKIAQDVKRMLPDFSRAPAVKVRDVFDTTAIDAVGYRYA